MEDGEGVERRTLEGHVGRQRHVCEIQGFGDHGVVKVDGAVAPKLIVVDVLNDRVVYVRLFAALAQMPAENLQDSGLDSAVVAHVHLLGRGLAIVSARVGDRLPCPAWRPQVAAEDVDDALPVATAVGICDIGEGVHPGDPHLRGLASQLLHGVEQLLLSLLLLDVLPGELCGPLSALGTGPLPVLDDEVPGSSDPTDGSQGHLDNLQRARTDSGAAPVRQPPVRPECSLSPEPSKRREDHKSQDDPQENGPEER